MAWKFFGTWHQYKPEFADPIIATTYLTNGQIDWYDLAHGKLEAKAVPQGGWWLVVHPTTRRVDKLRAASELDITAPAGPEPDGMELWWTNEKPLEFPYTGENGNLYFHQTGPNAGVLTYEAPAKSDSE